MSESASVLYDAQEYLVAGPANHAEWWEHLGDAHRDYAKLAQVAVAQAATLGALERIAWPEFERDSSGNLIGCRCGLKYDFCHAANAARYCGGDALRAQHIARQALGYYDEHGFITPKGQARYDELRASAGVTL